MSKDLIPVHIPKSGTPCAMCKFCFGRANSHPKFWECAREGHASTMTFKFDTDSLTTEPCEFFKWANR